MDSKRITTYNLLGNVVKENLREKDVYKKLNDLTDPLRFLLVKLMAGRSITLPTVKNVMSLRIADRKSIFGSITESPEQFIGRSKSVMLGTAQEDFSIKYGRDIKNVPGFNVEANCYDIYLPDTPMYRNAVKKHLEFDACTPDMLGFTHDLENYCLECGRNCECKSLHIQNDINRNELNDALYLN